MAAIPYYQSIDMNKYEFLNARAQNLASAPSSPVEGQFYLDTTLDQFGVYQNGGWVYLSSTITNAVTKASNAAAAGVGQVSGGTDRTLVDYAGGAGLVKSGATGIFSAATAGTDYSAGTAALGTGILKSTTTTGALSIAIAADFPTLNQNTTGTASNITGILSSSSFPALSGDVTTPSGSVVTTIANNVVTLAKMQTIATNSLLGRSTGGTGNVEIITVGSGLTFTGTTLSASGGGGTVTDITVASANGFAGTSSGGATPALTLTTTVTGILKGNGTAISAATAGTDYVTASSTNTFTNKTFDANGTGNSISNIETADFATNVIDIDVTLAANSDTRIASQKAVKAYVDGLVTGQLQYMGAIDASTNPNYPAALKGDYYKISVAGKIGGASGIDVQVGDAIIANADNAGGTQAGVGASWDIIQANVDQATTSTLGLVSLATSVEAEAKSSTTKVVTPSSLVNFPVKKIFTIGDGATANIVVTHNLGTQDIIASVRRSSDNQMVMVDITATSTSTATISFATAPASNAYKVTIVG